MRLPDVYAYFGETTQAGLARRLGVSQVSVHRWHAAGAIPPLSQFRIETLSGGALKADRAALFQAPR